MKPINLVPTGEEIQDAVYDFIQSDSEIACDYQRESDSDYGFRKGIQWLLNYQAKKIDPVLTSSLNEEPMIGLTSAFTYNNPKVEK